MAISIQKITLEQRDNILSLREDHFHDVKAIAIAPAKLTETLSAFANTDGGELYIGIDEKENDDQFLWNGFGKPEDANGHLQAIDALFPLGQECSYTFLECDGSPGLVLQIQIRRSRDIKKASNGIAYVRRGAQKIPVKTADQLQRLERDKGVTSFENETVDYPIGAILESPTFRRFIATIIPSAEPLSWLKKQLLFVNDKPTVAALLLFAEEPQAALPKHCGVKIYRYTTSDRVGTRDTLEGNPITIEGNLYDQIYAAVKKTSDIVERIQVLGTDGLELARYPSVALHEILTNAVLHRDYSIRDDVDIRIFNNRVEVESPGRLPGHVTQDNILSEQFARNGRIVRLINKFPNPPNKDVGEGLNAAFQAMRKLDLKEPVIEEREHAVLVNIRHEPLASHEEQVLEFLGKNAVINNSKAREICHIDSESKVKRLFERMMSSKLIERVPGRVGSAIAYRKVQSDEGHPEGGGQGQPGGGHRGASR